MNITEIKQLLEAEVPLILQESPGFKEWLQDFIRRQTISRESFDERFDRVLNELAADRENQRRHWDEQELKWAEQSRKWDENNQKWVEQNRKWDELRDEDSKKWEEQNRKWDELRDEDSKKWVEQNRKWDEDSKKWEEQNRKWDELRDEDSKKWEEQNRKWDELRDEDSKKWEEQNRKWDEQNRKWDETLKEIRSIKTKSEQGIGALGARWGIASEASFRAALKGILEDSFGVQVLNVNEFDDEGIVFGRPDQVELDIILMNGMLILCELKSSMSKGDMYIFERKVRYYEKRHHRIADRRIVVSPMVDAKAKEVAKTLGIEIFSYSEDVTGLV